MIQAEMIAKREFAKKFIFVVSDIHGHCDALRAALVRAGFDPECDKHLLVVMGDLFDRGRQNREVLEYLSGIKNKIILMGNHEDILLRALASGVVGALQEQNGTVRTIYDFFPDYSGAAYLPIDTEEARATRRMLTDLINSMWRYFESRRYIFTHGWLPVEEDGSILADFRYASAEVWRGAHWYRWHHLYGISRIPEEKTLVVGHTPVIYYARGFDPNRPSGSTEPFYGDRMIAIDACTAQTGVAGASDHGTFIAYAPADNPEVAISVVLENGNSASAAMVARQVLDAYFEGKAAGEAPTPGGVLIP